MALGIGGKQQAGGRQRPVLADAGEDILERAAFGGVIEHVVGGEQRDAEAPAETIETGETAMVAGAVEAIRHQADHAGEGIVEGGEGCGESMHVIPAEAGIQTRCGVLGIRRHGPRLSPG